MKKLLTTALFTALTGAVLLAQSAAPQTSTEASQEEKIELPEVTTVIAGDALTAGKDAIPDYAPVLPNTSDGAIELPTLGRVESSAAASPAIASSAQKSVYAQGRVGAGYPFMFLGDFGIYRATGKAPFSIDFTHKSIEGFGSEKAAEGFFLRDTRVAATQSYNTEKAKNTFTASYDTTDSGLQSLSDQLFDVVHHSISLEESSQFALEHGLFIGFSVAGQWYNRYGGKNTGSALDGVESSSSVVSANPTFNFGWKKDSFKLAFDAAYKSQLNTGDSDNFAEIEGSSSRQASHRGEFGLSSSWKSTYVALNGRAAIVAGTALGKPSVIAPFTAGIDLFIPYDEKGGTVTLKLEGGLKSEQADISELEKNFRYAIAGAIPTETSDWYGKGEITIPVKSFLTVSGGLEVYKTAFENGVWAPDYDSARTPAGLYAITCSERTEVNPFASATFTYRQFTITAGYKGHLKDAAAASDPQKLSAGLQYQAQSGIWSAGLSLSQAFGSGADATPNLGANASVRATSAIALALEAHDIVKLALNKTRDYASSAYKDESGNIAFLVKFQF